MKKRFLSMLLSALLLIPLCLPLTSCGECEVHTFGAWTTSIQATCTSTGQEVRTCTVCDAQETQGTSMLPHTFGAWTTSVQATCQSTGTDTRTCTACGKIETTTTPIGSHSEVKGKCQYCNAVMNAYDVLLYAARDKGSYNNGTYTLVLGSTTYDGSSYKRFAQYNATDDELQILILWKASTLLTITLSEYSTIYEYTLFADTYDYIMVGSFYPSTFSNSTTYLYYTDTNIPSSLIVTYSEFGAALANLFLSHLNTDLSSLGISAYDLGFINY